MSTYPSKDIVDQAEGAARCRACAEEPRARIVAVAPDSPAFDAGFEPGCFITSVDGQPLRDLIDWRWLSADDEVELGYLDLDGDAGTVVLERELGEDWGLEFDGVVYDGCLLYTSQEAAAALADKVDAIVVIGGRNSSNTTRLADICACLLYTSRCV